jgi:hypothetical protein
MKGILAAAVALLAVLVAGAGGAGAAGTVFVVRNTNDSGQFSLRAQIDAANANPGADQIVFNVPGTGVQTISVTSAPLPVITDPVRIDGRSQPGFAGTPLIRIDNGTGSTATTGLEITAGSSRVFGLDITGFGAGIALETGGGNTLAGNWIGLDPSGNVAGNTNAGVLLQSDSANNLIGGQSVAARNVISGNGTYGVAIGGSSGVTGNVVSGNYIGTNVAGGGARPNGIGVYLGTANANTIGGITVGARNVISGNTTDGVVLEGATGNTVQGNYIGLNAAGTTALPNGRYGVRASGGALGNMIGRSKGHNVISGNGSAGVAIFDAATNRNRVLGNMIGTDPAGTTAIPNGGDGVNIAGGLLNTVGGAVAAVRNVISGNTLSGVAISGSGAVQNAVVGNYIGTDAGGSAALPNGANGITISGSSKGNRIGEQVINAFVPHGTAQLTAKGNLISGNAGSGILLSGLSPANSDTSNNFVFGNFIGTDVSGTVALGNGQDGILIDSTSGNSIGGIPQNGGSAQTGRNVISGNKQMGVDIRGAGSTNNKVHDNFIGTDASGAAALGNTRYGVVIQSGASGNTVGGSLSTLPNVISGNMVSGVIVRGAGTDSNVLTGNLIGTNSSGNAALPNAQHGIEVTLGASNTTIGGNTADLRNVISGNPGSGIRAMTGSTGTTVQGNFIGTDAGGTLALGNGVNGVLLSGSSGNLVGGLSGKVKNLIAFNGSSGVKIDTANADQILGNSIDQNGSLGIALVGGGNDNQAAPTIVQVKSDTTRTTVKATLTSIPSKTFRIELFSSPACDPSGGGEGATFLGTKTIATDGTGAATFSIQVNVLPAGLALTETATRQDILETSQFSVCASSARRRRLIGWT